MRRSRSPIPSRRTTLLVLALISLTLLLLPHRWTDGLVSLVQVIVPLQDAASGAANAIVGSVDATTDSVSGETYDALRRQHEAMQHRVTALAAQAGDLEKQVEILTATRLHEIDGHRLGTAGRLIPARVVTSDLLDWRSSRLVTGGSLQGVRDGAAVVSNHFTIRTGEQGGVRDGMAILLGETLVGFVVQTGSHTSRVRLMDDVAVEMKVQVGRLSDEGFELREGFYWLEGRGNGRMEIRDADRRDVDSGDLQIGDVVVLDPSNEVLPAAMTIGRVAAIQPNRDQPLFATLIIEPEFDPRSLRRVYIYDPTNHTDAGAPSSR